MTWPTIPLGTLAALAMGQAPPGAETNTDGIGTPFYRSGEFGDLRPTTRIWTTKPLRTGRRDDVFICVVGANCGEVNLGVDGAIGRSVAAISPDDGLDQRFLYHLLTSLTDGLRKGAQGSAQGVITRRALAEIPVPLPPLDGQRRVVDLLEDRLSRLDAAESLVVTCLRRLMSLRKSVLAGLHDGDPTPLGELAIDSGYGTSEKCIPDGPGPAVVRIPNLIDGRIDLSDEKRIASAKADVERYRLTPGDLLIVRTNGSVELIGRSAIVQDGVDAAFASYLIRYKLRPDRVIPAWVQAMLSTPQVRAKIESLAASSAGQHNLSLGKLNPLELPVPTLDVQAARLSRFTELEDQANRLRVELSTAQSRGARLRRSLLSAAFSGRLTGDVSDQLVAEEVNA